MRADEPVTKQTDPTPAEERIQQIARSLAQYWARACVNAWRTVFPKRKPQ